MNIGAKELTEVASTDPVLYSTSNIAGFSVIKY